MENWRAKRTSGTWAAAVVASTPALTPIMAAAPARLPLGIGFPFLISSRRQCLGLGSTLGSILGSILGSRVWSARAWLAVASWGADNVCSALRGGNEGIAQG